MEEQDKKEQTTEIKRDSKGHFAKGCSGNPAGVPLGSKQIASVIKDAFYHTFINIGGAEELKNWVERSPQNKREFYKMILQVLPKETQLSGKVDGGQKLVLIFPDKTEKEQDKEKTPLAVNRVIKL